MTDDLDRYSHIRERDIDLVLCVTAPVVPTVWKLFRDHPHAPISRHSVSTATGEIDVVLAWSDHEVHIENKIDASFQPNQPDRYAERASTAMGTATTTVLLAPAAYLDMHRTEAEKFHRVITYEQLAEILEASHSQLGSELALLVRHAIEQHRRGRTQIVSELRTAFFSEFADAARQEGLPFENDSERGPGSGFFYIHDWEEVEGHKVELVAKFEHHRAIDIQITAAAHLDDSIAESCQLAGLRVRGTPSGTLIISREASFLEPDLPLDLQRNQLRVFIAAAAGIVSWWESSGRELLRGKLNHS